MNYLKDIRRSSRRRLRTAATGASIPRRFLLVWPQVREQRLMVLKQAVDPVMERLVAAWHDAEAIRDMPELFTED